MIEFPAVLIEGRQLGGLPRDIGWRPSGRRTLSHLRYDDFRIFFFAAPPVECDHFIETSRNASGGGSAIVSNDVDQ